MFRRVARGTSPSVYVATLARLGTRQRRLFGSLALLLAIGALAPAVGQAGQAPLLSVHGETLSWSAIRTQHVFRLLTTSRTGHSLSWVLGRSVTPPAVPGETVIYTVKAAHHESRWSNAVLITYPPIPPPEEPPGEEPPKEEPPKEEPPKEEPPKEEPPREEPPAQEGAGQARYRLDAASFFDPFTLPVYAPWVKRHITLIKGYPPFSDQYLRLFGLPLIGYHDPATEGQAPLAPAQIEEYVAKVRRDVGLGYKGVFVDDANWSAAFRPSPGPPAALAHLIEAIHAAEPGALIEMNSQYHDIWPLMKAHDPNVERALRFVNIVTKEFGVGPTAGINTAQDYGELFQFVDALHAKGIHVTMTGDYLNTDVPTREYNLASYFLLNDGGDFVNGVHETPEHWWPGFDVNLGKASGPRERSAGGLWKRRFAGGVVYAVEPEGAIQTIQLPKTMHSAKWGTVQSVTLAARQGAVLLG